LGIFASLVGLAAWHWQAIRTHASDDVIRFRVRVLIAFVVVLSLAVGLTQIEAWPITNWALVHTYRSQQMTSWEIEGIDASGAAVEVDPRVLQPLQTEEFGSWALAHLTSCTPAERELVMRYVLDRA